MAGEDEILAILMERSLSRMELVRRTGRPRTTVYNALERLEKKGNVHREVSHSHKRGRPLVLWGL